ncbi:hypothetical protein BVX98_05745 [bacterium F11]|nr:hypothetical protein BVX98_05745 [bacterium F11]
MKKGKGGKSSAFCFLFIFLMACSSLPLNKNRSEFAYPNDFSRLGEPTMALFKYGKSKIFLDESVGYKTKNRKFNTLFSYGTELPASYYNRYWVQTRDGVLFEFLKKSREGKVRKIGDHRSIHLNKGPGSDAVPFINLTVHIGTTGVVGVSEYSGNPISHIGIVKITEKKESAEGTSDQEKP